MGPVGDFLEIGFFFVNLESLFGSIHFVALRCESFNSKVSFDGGDWYPWKKPSTNF